MDYHMISRLRRNNKIKDVQKVYMRQEMVCPFCQRKIYEEEPIALVFGEDSFDKNEEGKEKEPPQILCVDCLDEHMRFIGERIDNWAQKQKSRLSILNYQFDDYRQSELKKKLDVVRSLQNDKRHESNP